MPVCIQVLEYDAEIAYWEKKKKERSRQCVWDLVDACMWSECAR